MDSDGPSVLVLDGDYDTSLVIAKELTEDLEATIVGTGTTRYSRLLRSTYCDYGAVVPPPDDPTYADAVAGVIRSARPDVVLPVGYESMAGVDGIRSAIPDDVSLCLPPSDSFRAAVDKAATLRQGSQLGIETPIDYSRRVADLAADGRPDVSDHLPFPVFLKARRENGSATTSPVSDPEAFWESYDRIAAAAPRGDVLVQEYVDGSDSTYGCGVLCFDNAVELTCVHEELRSVPRHGGSGTHLRLEPEESIARDATRLLTTIGWDGVALVEFKRRADGTFVLMEINPKFWASYALARRFGYRFASTIVAGCLDLAVETPVGSPAEHGEMVFPLRELQFQLENREEASPTEYAATVCRRTAAWDVDHRDLGAWLVPPVSLLAKLPTIDVSSPTRGTESTVRDERRGVEA
ncbi:ATP-dependent carboxylate-amine ligase [Natrialba sp. INN-245]|uniref:ATP-dependent carboxylate-amine ligase n=1 Tax=Natrialba sp. INN-245 TaxID=2690967 RepID=UPI00190F77D7|nr:ATP-dependent carboxylate-amine ligase [Natrialba sp. INN-245]